MAAVDDLAAQARQLSEQASEHKSAIRRHRRQLGQVMTALAALERECRRRGIGFTQEQAHASNCSQRSTS